MVASMASTNYIDDRSSATGSINTEFLVGTAFVAMVKPANLRNLHDPPPPRCSLTFISAYGSCACLPEPFWERIFGR
jgi:hypothetical protein